MCRDGRQLDMVATEQAPFRLALVNTYHTIYVVARSNVPFGTLLW
jgi:hypothetical protein